MWIKTKYNQLINFDKVKCIGIIFVCGKYLVRACYQGGEESLLFSYESEEKAKEKIAYIAALIEKHTGSQIVDLAEDNENERMD